MKMHFQTLLGGMDTGTQMQKEVARKRMEEVGPDQQIMWMRHDQRVKRGASDDQMLQCAVLDFLEGSSAENAKALVQAQRRPVGEMAREWAEKTFQEDETELKWVEAWQEMLTEGPELQKMLNGKQLATKKRRRALLFRKSRNESRGGRKVEGKLQGRRKEAGEKLSLPRRGRE